MTRLTPSRLQDDAKTAREENRLLAQEERLKQKQSKERRIVSASKAEKDRVWGVLLTAALHNISTACFDRLNMKEKNFLSQLGLFSEPEIEEPTRSWRSIHQSNYRVGLDALDRQINEIEKVDPLSESLPSLKAHRAMIAKEVFSSQLNEWPFKVGKSEKSRRIGYVIDIKELKSVGVHFEEYDIRWLSWLLGAGQSFFAQLERKLKISAKTGESYAVFIALPSNTESKLSFRNLEPGRRYERAWIASTEFFDEANPLDSKPPGLPYDYFFDQEAIARRGPAPDILRYFFELLGYQCTLRSKREESILKVKWA